MSRESAILPKDGGVNCYETRPMEGSTSRSDDMVSPKAKRQKLPLHLKKKVLSPSSRFNITVSNAEIEKSSKGYIPKNTSRSTSWAVHVFTQWMEQRNKCMEFTYPFYLLEKAYGHSIICECLQRFVSEARKG